MQQKPEISFHEPYFKKTNNKTISSTLIQHRKTRYNQLNKQHKSFIKADLLINKQKTKLKIYNRFID